MHKILLIIMLFCPELLFAQPTVISAPIPEAPSDYLARVEFVKNVADLFDDQTMKQLVTDNASRTASAAEILDDADTIKSTLAWTGQSGFLIKVRIERNILTNNTSQIGAPILVGAGEDPLSVLAPYVNASKILPAADPGCVETQDDVIFIWAKLGPNFWHTSQILNYGQIGPPFNKILEINAVESAADSSLIALSQEQERSKILGNVVDKLKEKASTDAERANFDSAMAAVKQYDSQVKQIDSSLQQALDTANDAASFLQTIAALKGILTFAELSGQATSLFPSDPSIKYASSTDQLQAAVSQLNSDENQDVQSAKQSLQTNYSDEEAQLKIIQDAMKAAGAPDSVINSTQPPYKLP